MRVRIYERVEQWSNLDDIRQVDIVKPGGYILVNKFARFEVQCEVHESVTEVVGLPTLHTSHEIRVTVGVVVLVFDVISMPGSRMSTIYSVNQNSSRGVDFCKIQDVVKTLRGVTAGAP